MKSKTLKRLQIEKKTSKSIDIVKKKWARVKLLHVFLIAVVSKLIFGVATFIANKLDQW